MAQTFSSQCCRRATCFFPRFCSQQLHELLEMHALVHLSLSLLVRLLAHQLASPCLSSNGNLASESEPLVSQALHAELQSAGSPAQYNPSGRCCFHLQMENLALTAATMRSVARAPTAAARPSVPPEGCAAAAALAAGVDSQSHPGFGSVAADTTSWETAGNWVARPPGSDHFPGSGSTSGRTSG